MPPTHPQEHVDPDELHSDLLARNLFVVIALGAVAFIGACMTVILH